MRIRLKGLNYSRKKLADGEIVTYWYAWRGGPRLDGQPRSDEFIASYNRTVAELPKKQTGTLDFILDKFQDSDAFLSRAPRTQSDYRKLLRAIANEFGDFPLAALADRKARGEFMEWRDGLAKRSRRQADYAWSVCEKGGRLYNASRSDRVWSDEDEAAFMRVA
jgi:hypothetical protein